jgi:hypothetical protein
MRPIVSSDYRDHVNQTPPDNSGLHVAAAVIGSIAILGFVAWIAVPGLYRHRIHLGSDDVVLLPRPSDERQRDQRPFA